MASDDRTLEARHDLTWSSKLLLGCLGFVAAAAACLIWIEPGDLALGSFRYDWAHPWVEWLAIVFFGMGALVFWRSNQDRRPYLRIDPSGITWRRLGSVTIPWSQIVGFEARTSGGAELLMVRVKDPGQYRGNGVAAILAWINKSMGYGDVVVPLAGLNRSAGEIVAAMRIASTRTV